MNAVFSARLIWAFVLLLIFLLVFSTTVYAGKKLTNEERKVIANKEYARCVEVVKSGGISAVLTYVQGKQKGTSLDGSSEKLAQENCVADAFGLTRYQSVGEIITNGWTELVTVDFPLIKIKDDVPEVRHVALPWVRDYIIELALAFDQAQHAMKKVAQPSAQLLVSSLIRSSEEQDVLSGKRLIALKLQDNFRVLEKSRHSFADCSSSAVCSTHLTGSTVDISLLGVDKKKREFLLARVLRDRENGRILAIWEKWGNHLHVFVIPPIDYG